MKKKFSISAGGESVLLVQFTLECFCTLGPCGSFFSSTTGSHLREERAERGHVLDRSRRMNGAVQHLKKNLTAAESTCYRSGGSCR